MNSQLEQKVGRYEMEVGRLRRLDILNKDMKTYFQKKAREEKEREEKKRGIAVATAPIEYLIETKRKTRRRCDSDNNDNVESFYNNFVKQYFSQRRGFNLRKSDKIVVEINFFDLTSNDQVLGGSSNMNCRDNLKVCEDAVERLFFKHLTLEQYESNISQLKNCNVWLVSKHMYIYVRNEKSTGKNLVGMCCRINENTSKFRLVYRDTFSNEEVLQFRKRIMYLAMRCDKLCFYPFSSI